MSGTGIPYPVSPATSIRACYAMSGTDSAVSPMTLHECYAMPGTEIAYATTRKDRGPMKFSFGPHTRPNRR
eukprot:274023-Rhodomonas_salina.3